MLSLPSIIKEGMRDHIEKPASASPLRLSYSIDDLVIYKGRIVIPPSLRRNCLSVLHAAHQGISSIVSRAETLIFWLGVNTNIHAIRTNCSYCNQMAPSQATFPPTPPILAAYPFQCKCADYFNYQGMNYLVIVDRYSNRPIVERAQDGSKGLIDALRQTFANYGIPDELILLTEALSSVWQYYYITMKRRYLVPL